MVSASPPSVSSTCSAAATTTSRLSCGLGTPCLRGADRHGGSGGEPRGISGTPNIVLGVNIVPQETTVQRHPLWGTAGSYAGFLAVALVVTAVMSARAFPRPPDMAPAAKLGLWLERGPSMIEAVFRKGAHSAAYSGFEGADADGIPLAAWLRDRGVTAVDIAGVATDHCVRATATDAATAGLDTRVLLGITAGVAAQTVRAAIDEMRTAGVELTGSPVSGQAARTPR
jgi:hypothetical protein